MAGLLVRKFIARCKQGDVVYPQNMKISPASARYLLNWEKKVRNRENLNTVDRYTFFYGTTVVNR